MLDFKLTHSSSKTKGAQNVITCVKLFYTLLINVSKGHKITAYFVNKITEFAKFKGFHYIWNKILASHVTGISMDKEN